MHTLECGPMTWRRISPCYKLPNSRCPTIVGVALVQPRLWLGLCAYSVQALLLVYSKESMHYLVAESLWLPSPELQHNTHFFDLAFWLRLVCNIHPYFHCRTKHMPSLTRPVTSL